MPDVRLPDGRIIRNVPEGTTREDIMERVGLLDSPKEPPMLDKVGRQAGLAARYGVEGAAAIPLMVGDAANSAINLGSMGINKLLGSNIPMMRMPSEVAEAGLDEVLPKPETPGERVIQMGSQALSGAGAAGMLAKAPGVLQNVAKFLADAPKLQAVGALGGATAVETAKGEGVENPLALMGLSILGGGVTTGAQGIGRQAKNIVSPATRSGRELVVGNTLRRLSSTPDATIPMLENAQEILPGSRPMVSQVSRDPGLIRAQNALEGMDEKGVIATRKSEQNAARMGALDDLAQDETTLMGLKRFRDKAYEELAEPAFKNAKPIEIGREWINNPILRKIQAIKETPDGARQTVRDALDEAAALLTQEGADITNAETLYAIRKDLALARDGKLTGKGKSGVELANLKTAKKQLADVISEVDKVIETGAPGYREYLSAYSERSIPLDQLKALQTLRRNAVLASTDALSGQAQLPVSFVKLLARNLDGGLNLRGQGPGGAKLNSRQLADLNKIAEDLDRGAAANSASLRSAGSDTFKNMTVAAVIGRALGQGAADAAQQSATGKAAANKLSFLYRVPEEQAQLLMLEAWTDPKLAARLMRMAGDREIEDIANEFKKRLGRQAAAAALYAGE